jgi:hypothetical protein
LTAKVARAELEAFNRDVFKWFNTSGSLEEGTTREA